ncbi:MAG: GNAT family N-acetyltransferase [Candidatus Berkiella sp.]
MHHFPIEIQDPQLVIKGLRATTRFFEMLASNSKIYKNTSAIVTGIDSPFLNVAYLNKIDVNEVHDICENISEFFGHFQTLWTFVVTPLSQPDNLKDYLKHEKFELLESVPCMYCDLSMVNTALPSDIVVEELISSDNLLEWIKPICEGFGPGDDNGEEFRKLNAKISQQDGVFKQFIAYSGNQVVSSGTLFLTEESVMIHNIATKKDSVKKGYGSALTIKLMDVAKNLGYKDCFLESSDSGYNLYRRCGFRVYGVNDYYVKKQ